MADKRFDKQVVGEPIAARTINEPVEFLEELSRAWYAPPLAATDASGTPSVRLNLPEEKDARITSNLGSGAYGFLEVWPGPSGTWTDGIADDNSGLDPAYEYNANAGIAVGTRIRMRRIGGEWRFQLAQCTQSSSSPSGPSGTSPTANRAAAMFMIEEESPLRSHTRPTASASLGGVYPTTPVPP